MTDSVAGISTRCVHAGDDRDVMGALHAPLYRHSTFGSDSTDELIEVLEGRQKKGLYTRFGLNPTILALEVKLAALEEAEAAVAFASGMAAMTGLILAHVRSGERIVCVGDVYGGTYDLLSDKLPALGIRTDFLDAGDLYGREDALAESTAMVIFETPTNPLLEVIDIERVAKVAHERGALCVVDSTFASPVNQQPLTLGTDVVVHSATKYLGGHDDLTAGCVMGPESLLEPIRSWRVAIGSIVAPEVAYELARSLRTLVVRVRAQNSTAEAIARFLAADRRVERVLHPSLIEGPARELAEAQMPGGFGGMVSFVVGGDTPRATRVVDALRLFSNAPSLGGVHSLATQPAVTSHRELSIADRAGRGISDGLIRLSTGLEEADDLIDDLDRALAVT